MTNRQTTNSQMINKYLSQWIYTFHYIGTWVSCIWNWSANKGGLLQRPGLHPQGNRGKPDLVDQHETGEDFNWVFHK